MIKKHLLIATVVLIPAVAGAQSYSDLNLRAFDPSVDNAASVDPFRPNSSQFAGTSRAEGDTIWYDDFANLDNWTAGTTGASGTADSLWEYTTTGPYGTFSGTWGDVESVTASNGWVMFDSDGNGSANPSNGAPTGVEFDTYLQLANPIDLSSYPVVGVAFTEFYKELSSETYLDVSTDGTNWTSIQLHPGFGANDATAHDEVLYQDITPIAGGQSSVWIRLRYVGYGYFWQVDDLMFVEGVENDLALGRIFTGNNENDYLYTKIPVSQAVSLELGAVAINTGGMPQTNVMVDWEISDGSNVVASGSEAMATSLAAGASDTLFFETNYTPSVVGDYTISMSVYSDQTDSNLANNDGSDVIEITEYVWGHDYTGEPYVQYGYSGTSQQGTDGFEMGADYFCKVDGDFIYALQFALGNNSDAESVTAKVYEDDPTNGAISETVYDIQQGDYSTNSNVKFITVVLDDPVEMLAGSVYTATVAIEPGNSGYIMGQQIDDDDRGQSVYFAFEDTWYYWSGLTTSMRINLNPDIAGIDDMIAEYGFGLYPNPARESFALSIPEEADVRSIRVLDMGGKAVRDLTSGPISNKLRVSTDGLASGMYFVEVITDQGAGTQKLIVR